MPIHEKGKAATPSPIIEDVQQFSPATTTPIDILTQALPFPAATPQPKRF